MPNRPLPELIERAKKGVKANVTAVISREEKTQPMHDNRRYAADWAVIYLALREMQEDDAVPSPIGRRHRQLDLDD